MIKSLLSSLIESGASKLGTYIIPIMGGIILTLFVLLCTLGYFYNNTLDKISNLEVLLKVTSESLDKANNKIETQNKAIEKLKITKEQELQLEKETTEIQIEYRDKIVYIEKELVKDNSNDNQIKIITKLLKEFSDESNNNSSN